VPGTAIDTSGMVDVAVRQQLELNSASPIVVQSDQKVNVANERLVQVAPQLPSKNISIAHVAARISPVGQVMVGVRNQSDEKRTVIRVMSDDRQSARQEVELPAKGQVRDYFLPIEPAAKVIRVEIEAADDFAADNLAFLVRHGSWPAIEAHTPVFAELQRLIEKYSKLRLPTAESKRVAMVAQDQAGGGAQVILAKPASPANGQLSVVDHPVTRALEKADWTAMARDGVSEPAGEGWRSVLRIGEKTAIAVREAPSRQIWMGLDTRRMANTPEFVMLWSNIFDWVGEGSEEFVARITGDLEPAWQAIEGQPAGLKSGWWPGIYRRSDGALLAINAPDVGVPLSTVSDWKSKISELARQHRQINGIRPLTVPLILAALALMLLAAITWRGGLRKIQQRQQPQRGQDARVTV
jgi:hypothetical protein